MKENIWERYGPYPKKKEKKKIRMKKEGSFMKKSFDWLQWRSDWIGGMILYHPCLEH